MLFKSVLVALAASQLVAGHGAIIKATGDAGGNGQALGSKCHILSINHILQSLTSSQSSIPLLVMDLAATHSNRTPLASAVLPPMLAVRPLEVVTTAQRPEPQPCLQRLAPACPRSLKVAPST